MLHGTFHLSVAITLTIILDTAPLAVEGGSTGVAPSQEVTVSTLAGQLVGGPPDVDGLRRAVPVPVTITFTVEPPVSVLYTEVCPTRHLVSVDVTLVAASGGVWVTCVHGLRSGTLPESITVTDTVLVLHTAVGVVEDRLAAVRLAVDVTGVAASVRVNQTGIFSFLRRTVIGTITATLAVKSVAIPTFERERGICILFDRSARSFDTAGNTSILHAPWDTSRNHYSGTDTCPIPSILHCAGTPYCLDIDSRPLRILGIGPYTSTFPPLEDTTKIHYRGTGKDRMLCSLWCG